MQLGNSYNDTNSDRYCASKMKKPVNFMHVAPGAKEVFIVGDFNDWSPSANPMESRPGGSWVAQLDLTHGAHHYYFLVDGQVALDKRAQGVARNEKNERVSLMTIS